MRNLIIYQDTKGRDLFIYENKTKQTKTGSFRINHKGNNKTTACNLTNQKIRSYSVVQASLDLTI